MSKATVSVVDASGSTMEKNEALALATQEAKDWKTKADKAVDETRKLKSSKASMSKMPSTKRRPWFMRGGMWLNIPGLAVNVHYPVYFLLATAMTTTSLLTSFTPVQVFLALYIVQVLHAAASEGMRTIYCVFLVPVYLASMLVLPGTLSWPIFSTFWITSIIGIYRTGICMSVCLHRYAAHAGFKCGPITQFFLNILGCLANQGGPIWWASQHRCHHKYCDAPRDPHSPIQDGVENSFAFFSVGHWALDEEFSPKHNDTKLLRLVDSWAFAVCALEMYAAYLLWGREGLYVSYTSQWLSQTITLWFNIANHPPDEKPDQVCQASNRKTTSLSGRYPLFMLMDQLLYLSVVVGEATHDDHHVHFMLVKRERFDIMYYSFAWWLEKAGLIWDVKKIDDLEKKH